MGVLFLNTPPKAVEDMLGHLYIFAVAGNSQRIAAVGNMNIKGMFEVMNVGVMLAVQKRDQGQVVEFKN